MLKRTTESNGIQAPYRILDAFLCPIGHELMGDPVIAADGHSYEKENIETWFKYSDVSPKTGLRLPHKNLTPNYALRSAIQDVTSPNPLISIEEEIEEKQDLENAKKNISDASTAKESASKTLQIITGSTDDIWLQEQASLWQAASEKREEQQTNPLSLQDKIKQQAQWAETRKLVQEGQPNAESMRMLLMTDNITLTGYLKTAIQRNDLPLVQLLIWRGERDFELSDFISALQNSARNFELASFLLAHLNLPANTWFNDFYIPIARYGNQALVEQLLHIAPPTNEILHRCAAAAVFEKNTETLKIILRQPCPWLQTDILRFSVFSILSAKNITMLRMLLPYLATPTNEADLNIWTTVFQYYFQNRNSNNAFMLALLDAQVPAAGYVLSSQQTSDILTNKELGISMLTTLIKVDLRMSENVFQLLIEEYAILAGRIENALQRLNDNARVEPIQAHHDMDFSCSCLLGFFFTVMFIPFAVDLSKGQDTKTIACFSIFLFMSLLCCCLPAILVCVTGSIPTLYNLTVMRFSSARHDLMAEYATLKKDMYGVIQALKEKNVRPSEQDMEFARSTELYRDGKFAKNILTALERAAAPEIVWTDYFSSSWDSLWRTITPTMNNQNAAQVNQHLLANVV